jgi:inner membrane protein involved in colicin E2 resistance
VFASQANSLMNNTRVTQMTKKERKSLSFFETLGQALSLLFALQNKDGRKKLMDLAEDRPLPLILSGVVAMVIFFLICFLSSQIVIKMFVS